MSFLDFRLPLGLGKTKIHAIYLITYSKIAENLIFFPALKEAQLNFFFLSPP